MPVYRTRDRVVMGAPLGGVGAGKLEILPNGLLNAFTFQNNWSHPIAGNGDYPGILGYHFGISAQPAGGKKKAVLLQTVPVGNIPRVRNITYESRFPRVTLTYEEPSLGLDVSLEVSSPWIPSDLKHSSLPCVYFTLKVKNNRSTPQDVGFIFIGRNTCGDWCVGRRNRVEEGPGSVDLEFFNEDRSKSDPLQGSLRFSFSKGGWKTSFLESWNAVTKNFSFHAGNISLLGWDTFVKEGRLPNRADGHVVQGENQELCGAVAATQTIPPRGERIFRFIASWYFPHHRLGHRYENWFGSAAEAARYGAARREGIEKKIRAVQRAVGSLPFPDWFNDALLTNLAPFFASTWYARDGRFACYEAPVICPLMGTLDVGFYGSIPVSYFFPEWEISQITQFAEAQRPDGYIPHDLGKNRLDLPSNGTTFYQWKDLNPKFILMTYRDALWSGNKAFLRRLYPHVKRALAWTVGARLGSNGLPEHEGADQTFDLWAFHGPNPYTSGIFLAALLAGEKMGRLMGDPSFAGECRDRFRKSSQSFEKEFWNGKYFGGVCSLSQLNGQWYADLLGLGPIADRRKIRAALGAILKRNSRPSAFGMVNSVLPDGRLDRSNRHSRNIWPGMNYAFISLCVMEGFPLNNLLKQARKLWHNVTHVQRSPWNQPDMVNSATGKYVFGDYYYRNMAIWAIPIALAMKDKKTAAIMRSLRSLSAKGGRVK
ncbi:MAG: GH116 family glycosyl hydrolase [Candidatus Omnitrophota bacterium]